jgi:hypothetical protein
MDTKRDLSAVGGQQLAQVHPFSGGCQLGQLCPKIRGVTADIAKFRDRKGNEADVGVTPHPLLALLELSRLSTA